MTITIGLVWNSNEELLGDSLGANRVERSARQLAYRRSRERHHQRDCLRNACRRMGSMWGSTRCGRSGVTEYPDGSRAGCSIRTWCARRS